MGDRSAAPQQPPDRKQHTLNLVLASLAGQVGCLTLVIVIAALLLGLWLDNQFQTRPIFTILTLIGSMPVAMFVMYRVAMSAVAQIKPAARPAPRGTEGTQIEHDS